MSGIAEPDSGPGQGPRLRAVPDMLVVVPMLCYGALPRISSGSCVPPRGPKTRFFIRETASKHPPQNFSASVCATECFPLLPYPVRGLTEYRTSYRGHCTSKSQTRCPGAPGHHTQGEMGTFWITFPGSDPSRIGIPPSKKRHRRVAGDLSNALSFVLPASFLSAGIFRF